MYIKRNVTFDQEVISCFDKLIFARIQIHMSIIDYFRNDLQIMYHYIHLSFITII